MYDVGMEQECEGSFQSWFRICRVTHGNTVRSGARHPLVNHKHHLHPFLNGIKESKFTPSVHIIGTVMGVLYISTSKIAFCSENPLRLCLIKPEAKLNGAFTRW